MGFIFILFTDRAGGAQLTDVGLKSLITQNIDDSAVQMEVVGNYISSGLEELIGPRLKLDSLDSTLPPNYTPPPIMTPRPPPPRGL